MQTDLRQPGNQIAGDVRTSPRKGVEGSDGNSWTPEQPLISIITVNFNGLRHLQISLPSIFASPELPLEVIVVDNGSTDGSIEWLRFHYPEVTLLPLERNVGFGEANRRGVEIAVGEYIVFLNNDTRVQPGWLTPLLDPLLSDAGIAASCSTLLLMDQRDVVNARGGGMTRIGFGYDSGFMTPYRPGESSAAATPWSDTLFPTGAAMLMRKKEFESLGGFDREIFMYHEDVDLGWRIWLLGRRVVVCSNSLVHHRFGGTTRYAGSERFRVAMGMRHNLRTLIKHYERRNLLAALKRITRMWHRDRAYGIVIPALLWNIRHLPSTLRERRSIQSLRSRSDEELFQQGLIGREDIPPEPPMAPALERVAGDWVVSPILFPGRDSAEGRLGAGWYGKHLDATGWSRWTRGDARCVLRVEPCRRGVLALTLRLFERVEGERVVRVACNGLPHTFPMPEGSWTTVELPVEADADGMLVVDIASPTWSPHRSFNNGEFRTLGCGVQRVEFMPNEPRVDPLYGSVSVIVPTYNRWPILAQTLAALRAQTWRQMEVIVIDDGSTDGTWEKLREWKEAHGETMRLTLLRQENGGPGKGRNRALREATGDLVIFIGDDIIPSNDFVEQHITRQNELGEGCALLGFTDWHRDAIKVTPIMEYVNLYGAQFNYGNLTDGEETPFGCLYTSNISIPRRILGEMPFDSAFTVVNWEDIDLGYRLSLRGVRIIYHRGATARHLHPMSLAGLMRRQHQTGEIYHIILGLHPELAANPIMPDPAPPLWVLLFAPLLLWSVPLFDLLDRRGIALPHGAYLALLQCAFYNGRRRHGHQA